MTEGIWIAVLALAVPVTGLLGTVIGSKLNARATVKAAVASATAQVKVSEDTAQDKLIDQLQQELERYRERTDKRLDELEVQVRGYRAFIGVQRDHMAEHGVPLPPWPDHLPR